MRKGKALVGFGGCGGWDWDVTAVSLDALGDARSPTFEDGLSDQEVERGGDLDVGALPFIDLDRAAYHLNYAGAICRFVVFTALLQGRVCACQELHAEDLGSLGDPEVAALGCGGYRAATVDHFDGFGGGEGGDGGSHLARGLQAPADESRRDEGACPIMHCHPLGGDALA